VKGAWFSFPAFALVIKVLTARVLLLGCIIIHITYNETHSEKRSAHYCALCSNQSKRTVGITSSLLCRLVQIRGHLEDLPAGVEAVGEDDKDGHDGGEQAGLF
jgi:hypothetical protein